MGGTEAPAPGCLPDSGSPGHSRPRVSGLGMWTGQPGAQTSVCCLAGRDQVRDRSLEAGNGQVFSWGFYPFLTWQRSAGELRSLAICVGFSEDQQLLVREPGLTRGLGVCTEHFLAGESACRLYG